MNVNKVALEAVLKEEGFVKHLLSLETPEEAQAAFAEKGIEFTIEEIKEIANAINNEVAAADEKEFTEDELDVVAGGILIEGVTAVGVAKLVVAVGGLGLAVYEAVKAGW